MKTLKEIHEEWKKEHTTNSPISATNIDDIIWYAKARGIEELAVLPGELKHIWQFLVANLGDTDIQMRRLYFINGRCDDILGVKITVLPYTYESVV